MFFIIDKKIPGEAKENLKGYGEVVEFQTEGLTNEYLSGHPDIFFLRYNNELIYAPNLPKKYIQLLKDKKIKLAEGNRPVEFGYPDCALYNAVSDEDVLIHRTDITEKSILERFPSKKRINIKQGFTRCSLVYLRDGSFITSDHKIRMKLENLNYEVFYVNPEQIILPGVKHGFFGGCCGVFEQKFFIIGKLSYINEGQKLEAFLRRLGFEIIELYEGPLFDGGSILVL